MLFGENVTNIAMKTKELIKTSIAYDDVLKQLTNMSLIRNAIFVSMKHRWLVQYIWHILEEE